MTYSLLCGVGGVNHCWPLLEAAMHTLSNINDWRLWPADRGRRAKHNMCSVSVNSSFLFNQQNTHTHTNIYHTVYIVQELTSITFSLCSAECVNLNQGKHWKGNTRACHLIHNTCNRCLPQVYKIRYLAMQSAFTNICKTIVKEASWHKRSWLSS